MLDKANVEKLLSTLHEEAKKSPHQNEIDRVMELYKLYEGEDHLVSSLELAERIKSQPEEKKYMTGFTDLDRILGGFRENQLVVIAAPTKNGKTSFCIDLTVKMKETNPTWLPFEEGAEELIRKFIERNEEPPLFYTPETVTGNTTTWVESKVIEAKAKFDSKIMFIDHLHFIVRLTGNNNMSLEIGKTMRELKGIAKRWNVIIVLIAHLKKTEVDKHPTLDDIRDSSFIAQEADTAILLWREAYVTSTGVEITNNTNVSVQANRRTGKTGTVKLVFSDGKFLPRADDFEGPITEEYNDGWI